MDDHDARRRREAIARRALRWRLARAIWWPLSDILDAIEQPRWLKPAPEQFYREFFDALKAGTFDARGKSRVALLTPKSSIALETPWPQVRLTADRAQRLVDLYCAPTAWQPDQMWHFGQQFGRDLFAEIDRVHNWLATWVAPLQLDGLLRRQDVSDALKTAAERQQQPAAQAGSTSHERAPTRSARITSGNEQVDAAIHWFAAMAANMVANGDRLTRDKAWGLAREKFGSVLSQKAFRDRVWPAAASAPWKARGRPKTKPDKN